MKSKLVIATPTAIRGVNGYEMSNSKALSAVFAKSKPSSLGYSELTMAMFLTEAYFAFPLKLTV